MTDRGKGEVRRWMMEIQGNAGEGTTHVVLEPDEDGDVILAPDHEEVVAGKDDWIKSLEQARDSHLADRRLVEGFLSKARTTISRLEGERDERQEERDKLRMVLGLMAGGVGRSLPEEAEHQLDTLRARVSELEGELAALTPPSPSG